ncbi:MAG: DUF523 and DUF1722 domain-containing protein [Deltaproteobacteria bacterium]|nr:DUF523 and DUF1722 domain-containing protein [Deltaproteobacteria bacterium]
MSPIKLGISACLAGQKTRYDGGHRWDRFLTDTMGCYLELVPICPEAECGLGVPREPMRLTGRPEAPRLLTVRTGRDLTGRLAAWIERKMGQLATENLSGFIFKSKSPSCGPARVKVYDEQGKITAQGTGLFARAFQDYFPLVPVEDEGRLHDPEIRDNFLEQLFFWRRWRDLGAQKPKLGDLVAFHSRHKYQLLAHSNEYYRQMGRLVARAGEMPLPEALIAYRALALAALRLKSTASKNANVLYHVLGYFKKRLSNGDKQELLEAIESYRRGEAPLIVPVTLINHYVRKYQEPYLKGQTYLNPDPLELRLRNHA